MRSKTKKKTFAVASQTKAVVIRFNTVVRKGAVKRGKKFTIPREAVQVIITATPKRTATKRAARKTTKKTARR